jgi:tryptophan synthase beta chain
MRWNLPDSEMPTTWFNVAPHLAAPLEPPLHPATRQPVAPDDLAPLFPMALIAQEVTNEPTVEIPGEVLDVLR